MDSGHDLTTGNGAQREFVAGLLTGSQRKTSYALRQNVESLIAGNAPKTLRTVTMPDGETHGAYVAEKPENLNCVGFLTLTIGDTETDLHGRKRFVKIYDAAEASRRINNLNRRFLKNLFERAIVVTERHKDKGIHFHIIGLLRSREDIRTGFDFAAFKEIRKIGKKFSAADVGASPELAAIWKTLRETLPGYGFGRAELTPIEKAGEAIASYVAKYIEKNVCNRIKEDKRKKLVRYVGFEKTQLKPNEFSWGTKRAIAWRGKARAMASLVNIYEKEEAAANFGARWAHFFTSMWQRVTGDDLSPFLIADWNQTELLRASLVKKIGLNTARKLDRAQRFSVMEEKALAIIRENDAREFERIQLSRDIDEFCEEMAENYANN
jgi:hypothetical protein